MASAATMPERGRVDPLFDGHMERAHSELSPTEKLDWLWELLQLSQAGAGAGERSAAAKPPRRARR